MGNHVSYGVGAIVHGGGRPVLNAAAGVTAPTVIENNVRLGNGSVAFRSLVRNDARIGERPRCEQRGTVVAVLPRR